MTKALSEGRYSIRLLLTVSEGESTTVVVGNILTDKHGAGAVVQSLHPEPQVAGREREPDVCPVHTSSNKATPNPSQTVLLTGDQASNHHREWQLLKILKSSKTRS